MGVVSVDGTFGEYNKTWEDGSQDIGLYVEWSTKCNDCTFAQAALIQNWAEWPDPDNTGKFMGMMCSAVWDRNGDYASATKVENYKNTTTLSDNTMAWNRDGW